MIVVTKAKAAWSQPRTCWRLDVHYLLDDVSKRTYVVIPGARDKVAGRSDAEQAAAEFAAGLGGLFGAFMAKHGGRRAGPVDKGARSSSRHAPDHRAPSIAWLLNQCLAHPEVWGNVKHSRNYRYGARKVASFVGDRLVSDFEPPNGSKLVTEFVTKLRHEDASDGYVRKIAYMLRQSLGAAIGKGVSEPIVHPATGEQLLSDIPAFPALPKSGPRAPILAKVHGEIVLKVIGARVAQARDEERAFQQSVGVLHDLTEDDRPERVARRESVVWLNSKRFSSNQWQRFRDYMVFVIETGCRRSEALSMGNHSICRRETVEDGSVSQAALVLHIPDDVGRNGTDRYIRVTPRLRAAMTHWTATAVPHSYAIGDRTITRDRAWFPLQATQVGQMWDHVRADAKLYGVDLSLVTPQQLHSPRFNARHLGD